MKKIKNYYSKFVLLLTKHGFKNEQVNKNLLILLSLFLLSTLIVMLFSIFVLQNVLTSSYLSQKEKQEKFFFWIEKVEEFPNSPDVLYNAAVVSVEVEKHETALKLLKKAIDFDPQFDEAKNLQKEIIEGVR